jgi:hypothetical protein
MFSETREWAMSRAMRRIGLAAVVLGLAVGAASRARATITFDATTGLYDYTDSLDLPPSVWIAYFNREVWNDTPRELPSDVTASGPSLWSVAVGSGGGGCYWIFNNELDTLPYGTGPVTFGFETVFAPTASSYQAGTYEPSGAQSSLSASSFSFSIFAPAYVPPGGDDPFQSPIPIAGSDPEPGAEYEPSNTMTVVVAALIGLGYVWRHRKAIASAIRPDTPD